MPQDVKKALTFAGRKICFETEELAQMKQFDKSGELTSSPDPATSILMALYIVVVVLYPRSFLI